MKITAWFWNWVTAPFITEDDGSRFWDAVVAESVDSGKPETKTLDN